MVNTYKRCFLDSPSLRCQLEVFWLHLKLMGSNMKFPVAYYVLSQYEISLPGPNLSDLNLIYLQQKNCVASRFSWSINIQGQFHSIRKPKTIGCWNFKFQLLAIIESSRL